MKKVCITTYCVWSSYGSMLQSYGLQHALKEIQWEGFIASPDPKPRTRWKSAGIKAGSLRQIIVDGHQLLIAPKLRRKYTAAHGFIEKNINIQYFGSEEALRRNPPPADAYLTGSDQVWNPKKLTSAFFLEFVPQGSPRISYAASMGITQVPAEHGTAFQRLICGFDHISLREQDTLPVIRRYTDRPAQVHIDPVFLVSRNHWREKETAYRIRRPYFLVYPIYWDKKLNRELKWLSQQTGKDIVAVLDQARRVYAHKRIYDASPEEFLWLIDHADGVISSSFHAIAMSLVFNKPFSAVIDPGAPSRLSCLLDGLGAYKQSIRDLAGSCKQDFERINRRIKEEQGKSMAYLRKVL